MTNTEHPPELLTPACAPTRPRWAYEDAFARHRGLISADEQQRLRASRVAIIGMGGVGGIHLMTLARLGVGGFHVADPDGFEVVNFNRQYGASTLTLGRNKAEVMAEQARAVNPELEMRVFPEAITAANVGPFLDGVNLLVDGIDFFAISARRMLFREARRRGIWAVTAGPVGFSAAWLCFSPNGMSFDEYFDFNDAMTREEQLIAFVVGLAPRATHLSYFDMSQVDARSGRGPSAGLACHLCSGVAGAEAVKILLGRSPVKAAPHYFQFDAYRHLFRKGRLLFGNRNPIQRFKRWLLYKKYAHLFR